MVPSTAQANRELYLLYLFACKAESFGKMFNQAERFNQAKEVNPPFYLNASVARAEQDRQTSLGKSDRRIGLVRERRL